MELPFVVHQIWELLADLLCNMLLVLAWTDWVENQRNAIQVHQNGNILSNGTNIFSEINEYKLQ
jgi:hypothetical protein